MHTADLAAQPHSILPLPSADRTLLRGKRGLLSDDARHRRVIAVLAYLNRGFFVSHRACPPRATQITARSSRH